LEGKVTDPRGGQLDRQWQAVQVLADLGHHGRVGLADVDVRNKRLRSLDEESHRFGVQREWRRVRRFLDRFPAAAWIVLQRERRDGQDSLPSDP
jgi:hypothetical protein